MRALTPRAVKLQERLGAAGVAALRNMPEPELGRLQADVRALRAVLGGTGAGAGASSDRIRTEVLRFR